MSYQIQWEEGGTYTRFFGPLTKEDLLGNSKEIFTDPRVQGIRYAIADFIDITDYDVTAYDALLLAAQDYEMPYRCLAVIATDEKIIGLANRYATSPLMRTRNIKITSCIADARSWLAECNQSVEDRYLPSRKD